MIVLDTNVLIAAFIARGVCAELLEHCILQHEVVVSQPILDELGRHLVGKFKFSQEVADEVLNVLRSQTRIVAPRPLEQSVCRDPDDDNILAVAISAECDCIITGDEDLLILKKYEGIDILSPRDFLSKER